MLAVVFFFLAAAAAHGAPDAPEWRLRGKWVGGGVIYDVASGRSERFLTGEGRPLSAALSPDGRTLAVVSLLPTRMQVELRPLVGGKAGRVIAHAERDVRVQWSADGRYLLIAATVFHPLTNGFDDVAYLVRPDQERSWKLPSAPNWWPAACDQLVTVEFPLGRAPLLLHRTTLAGHEQEPTKIPGVMAKGRLSPDGSHWASASPERGLWIYDLEPGVLRQIADPEPGQRAAQVAFWSPDNDWVAVCVGKDASAPGRLLLWNLFTGERRAPKLDLTRPGWDDVQWWAPPREPPPDCRRAVEKQLGTGNKVRYPMDLTR